MGVGGVPCSCPDPRARVLQLWALPHFTCHLPRDWAESRQLDPAATCQRCPELAAPNCRCADVHCTSMDMCAHLYCTFRHACMCKHLHVCTDTFTGPCTEQTKTPMYTLPPRPTHTRLCPAAAVSFRPSRSLSGVHGLGWEEVLCLHFPPQRAGWPFPGQVGTETQAQIPLQGGQLASPRGCPCFPALVALQGDGGHGWPANDRAKAAVGEPGHCHL